MRGIILLILRESYKLHLLISYAQSQGYNNNFKWLYSIEFHFAS